jgi:hypothetical protein
MEELPNELLLHIFSYLHITPPITCFSSPRATDPPRDLVVLCRVCRRLKDVATSLVYESIERAGNMDSPAFRQLPRTLLNNMELCRYIKNVRLKMEDGSEVGDVFGVQDLRPKNDSDAEEHWLRETEVRRSCRYQRRYRRDAQVGDDEKADDEANKVLVHVPENYKWLGNLVSAMNHNQAYADDYDLLERAVLGEDVLLTPCLLSAHNLERLWIRFPRSQLDETHRSFLLNSLAYNAQHGGFAKLKVLHLDIHRNDLEWPVSNALPFFLLPNLTDLTLGNCGKAVARGLWTLPDQMYSTFIGKPWTWPVRTSPITRLSLLSPRFSGSIAAEMLRACRAITEFEVVLPYEMSPYDITFYEDVGMALVEHTDTLTRLSLGDQSAIIDGYPWGSPDKFRTGPLLTSLTFLRAHMYILFGYDTPPWYSMKRTQTLSNALPPTIEELWLDLPCRAWNVDMSPYFTGLFEAHKNGQFPHLKQIYIYWYQRIDHAFDRINYYLKHLMGIRQDALMLAPAITFDIFVRVDCGTWGNSSQDTFRYKKQVANWS